MPAEGLKAAHVTPKEVELAKRLIDDMTEHWKPAAFKDTYHQDLMRRIHEKIKKGETKEITEPEAGEAEAPRSAQIIDLAALLKQSLDKGGARRKGTGAAAPSRNEGRGQARASRGRLRVAASVKPAAKRKRA